MEINYEDDLVGSDTLLNSGFIYNQEEIDPGFGNENPCFLFNTLTRSAELTFQVKLLLIIMEMEFMMNGMILHLILHTIEKEADLGIEIFLELKIKR